MPVVYADPDPCAASRKGLKTVSGLHAELLRKDSGKQYMPAARGRILINTRPRRKETADNIRAVSAPREATKITGSPAALTRSQGTKKRKIGVKRPDRFGAFKQGRAEHSRPEPGRARTQGPDNVLINFGNPEFSRRKIHLDPAIRASPGMKVTGPSRPEAD